MGRRILSAVFVGIAIGAGASLTPAAALGAKDCSVEYQAAKAAGTLNGRTWNDYR